MRRLLSATVLACLLLSADAGALVPRQVFGIGNTTDFTAARLRALQPRATRLNTPWNVALHEGYARDRVDNWYRLALAAGLDPLLSFQGTGDEKVPSVARYRTAFRAALKRWPRMGEWQTWNEGNHSSQPVTWKHPQRAARYAKAMEQSCPRCTVLPITIVLSDGSPTKWWIAHFLKTYGKTPKIWAVHNYGDVNRGGAGRLKHFIAAHRRGRIWITETGAFAKFANLWPYSLRRQARRAAFAFRSALHFRTRVDRVYWWEWRGQFSPRRAHWDTGLVDALGKPRPVYFRVLKERFRSH